MATILFSTLRNDPDWSSQRYGMRRISFKKAVCWTQYPTPACLRRAVRQMRTLRLHPIRCIDSAENSGYLRNCSSIFGSAKMLNQAR